MVRWLATVGVVSVLTCKGWEVLLEAAMRWTL